MQEKPFCRRCLLEQTGQADLAASVRDAVAAIPEREKASKPVVRSRLAACQDCEALLDGMCRYCGCFVQLRAAKAKSGCPSPYGDRWKSAAQL